MLAHISRYTDTDYNSVCTQPLWQWCSTLQLAEIQTDPSALRFLSDEHVSVQSHRWTNLVPVRSESKSLSVCQVSVKAVIYASLNLCRWFLYDVCTCLAQICHACAISMPVLYVILCSLLIAHKDKCFHSLMKCLHKVKGSWHTQEQNAYTVTHVSARSLSLYPTVYLISWLPLDLVPVLCRVLKKEPQARRVKLPGSHTRKIGADLGWVLYLSYVLPVQCQSFRPFLSTQATPSYPAVWETGT